MAKTKFSIEEAFQELDQILQEMESPELSLSDSMNLYKKGVRLLDKCNQTLDKTEKEIIVLQEGQNGTILKREDSE
ncbi:MAG: exodeoxyribonuclease VII small subunit [Anaerobutyricum sp.]|nr:exodeoxyribonuclease VII small subunit [Eubacterium sp.]MDY6045642.1 exodeoxyribonuclease VII small subunit [Anaerobutyricum sp.]